jgi:pyruvate dehydrogenase (quinone)
VVAADMPVPVEARTDPEVPPLPPHVTSAQAQAYASAIVKGDPGGWEMVKRSIREMLAGYLPR